MQPVRRPHFSESGELTGFTLIDFVELNPNDGIADNDTKREAKLLEDVAELARTGKIDAVATMWRS